jgi:hypothetical protein
MDVAQNARRRSGAAWQPTTGSSRWFTRDGIFASHTPFLTRSRKPRACRPRTSINIRAASVSNVGSPRLSALVRSRAWARRSTWLSATQLTAV